MRPKRLSPSERATLLRLINSDVVAWGERNFTIEDRFDLQTGEELGPGLITLAEHQKRILRAALQRDKEGKFRWTTIIYSAVKKSGKTRVAALVAAWLAQYSGVYAEVYCLANDGKQSTDRVLAAIKKAIALGPALKEWKDLRTRINLPSGAFIEAVPVDPTGEAGANPTGTFWCFDEETEILTRDGWKNHKTLDVKDEVATLSRDEFFEWQPTQGIFRRRYDGWMWGTTTRRCSMLVTPDHKVIGKFSGRGGKHIQRKLTCTLPVQSAAKMGYTLPTVACRGWVGEFKQTHFWLPGTKRLKAVRLPQDLWVQFLAWYLAEGCVMRGRKKRAEGILIAQSESKNPENRKQIKQLAIDLGFRPRSRKDGSGFEIWDARLGNYFEQFGKAHSKWVPRWVKDAGRNILELFLQTYRKGDGWDHGRGFYIGTASEQMADDLLEIGQKLGYCVSYRAYPDMRSKYLQRKVRFLPGHRRTPEIRRKQWEYVPYQGVVWCPSTENGVVFVRRKGTCYWSGNSEMWGFRLNAKERLWTEMTIPPTKMGRAICWVESYAGYVGESPVLEQLYDEAVNKGKRHPAFPELPVYINERGRMFCYWDHEPRMVWQTPAFYQAEAIRHTETEFRRVHRNEWVTSIAQAIPIERWDACYDPALPPLTLKEPVVIGVDLGVSGDFSALAVASPHPKRKGQQPAIRAVEVFEPPLGGKLDYSQTIEPALRRWCKGRNVVCVPYDEYQAHKMAIDLSAELGVWFEPFPQGKGTAQNPGRPVGDKMFYDLVMSGRLAHNGDPTLRQHVMNAAGKSVEEKSLRFVKKSERLKIDALVAASMAVATLSRLNLS